MSIDTWRHYAKCFATSGDERERLMNAHLSPTVVYRDPNTEVHGHQAFAAEMTRTQAMFPGHTFEVFAVDAHHDRSVARWRLLDADGNHVANGLSHAIHDTDGRLSDITGFYPIAPVGWC
ncbi:MAG TPA: nuclear transport factor 2 family protein [Rugosimonospora sp.]|nr:nuclear transport factor 2 family protein [Rugosimonospora sp.]